MRHTHRYVARFTLEATTAISLASGDKDGLFDVSLVHDANGLPTIPGTALAGVLRSLYLRDRRREHDEEWAQADTNEVFGQQDGKVALTSRLAVSFGFLQDSHGDPVDQLLLGEEAQKLRTDPMLVAALAQMATPTTRDRVSLNHRGVSQNFFNRTVLNAGYRFSGELILSGNADNDGLFKDICGLLCHPLLRLGGATRAGLGRVECKSLHIGSFDLQDSMQRRVFLKLNIGVGNTIGLSNQPPKAPEVPGVVRATLQLTPQTPWRFGGGDEASVSGDGEEVADLLPKMESCWSWKDGKAEAKALELLVPASSIKGALAHRVAFYLNCEAKRWAENTDEFDATKDPDLVTLFGDASDDKRKTGQAGHVLIDDAYAPRDPASLQVVMHNSIDRFTGGVRNRFLFTEEVVHQTGAKVTLTIETDGVSKAAQMALARALDDLRNGELPLGAASSRGLGFFECDVDWHGKPAWLPSPGTEVVKQ
ncbi:MAG: RAMP superfamily CRISPR-associated protein [Gammaproteobacteria bacterium]